MVHHVFFLLILKKQIFTIVRYCECFAAGIYCDNCNCISCQNNVENEAARKEAVGATLERNPYAFRPKIACSPRESQCSMVRNLTPPCTIILLDQCSSIDFN